MYIWTAVQDKRQITTEPDLAVSSLKDYPQDNTRLRYVILTAELLLTNLQSPAAIQLPPRQRDRAPRRAIQASSD